jgi:hypothetical protein
MTALQPPRVATWLLERSDVDEPLIGDLVERYKRRPSRLWYWRQVLFAIVADIVSRIREHPLLIVRGVALGAALIWFLRWSTGPLSVSFGVFVWNWTIEHELDGLRVLIFQPSGWPLAVVWAGLLWPLAGWLVARTHRPHGVAVVIALVTAHVLFYSSQNGWLLVALGDDRPPFVRFATISAYWLTVTSVFLLIGGVLAASPHSNDRSARPLAR